MDAVAKSILANTNGCLSKHECDGVFASADVSSLLITLVFHHDDPLATSSLNLLSQSISTISNKSLSDSLTEPNGSVLDFVLSGIAASDKLRVGQVTEIKELLRELHRIERFAGRVDLYTLKALVRVLLVPVDDTTDPEYWWQVPYLLLVVAEKVEGEKVDVLVDGMMALALRTDSLGIIDRAMQSSSIIVKNRLAHWRDEMLAHRADLPNWAKSKVGSFIGRLN